MTIKREVNADALRICLECMNAGGCVDQEVIDAVFAEVAEPEPVALAETTTHARYPGDFPPSMDIGGPQRRRVMFANPESGYPSDGKRAAEYLVPGRIYSTVSVDVGSSRTNVELAECPGVRFNSVHFIDWPPMVEPEQPAPYDYHADWTRHPDPSGNNDVHWTCNYCGVYRDRPPTAPHDHAECRGRTRKQPTPSEPVIDEPALAADPRRLTQDEILDFWDGPLSRDDFVRAVRGIESIIREATAAAKPVTISEKSANEMYRWIESGQCQHEDFYFWLDRNGVEVAE